MVQWSQLTPFKHPAPTSGGVYSHVYIENNSKRLALDEKELQGLIPEISTPLNVLGLIVIGLHESCITFLQMNK